MKAKIINILLFLSLFPSFFLLNSCQQKTSDQEISADAKKIKQNLEALIKKFNVKTFEELRALLTKYKDDIEISNEVLKILGVKDLDSAIDAIDELITKQNNSKKAHALSCFMFDTNGLVPYEKLLNKFDDKSWKNEYKDEIELLCKKLEVESSKFDSHLQIDKEIINLATEYAKDIYPSFVKTIKKERDTFIDECKNKINAEFESENDRVCTFACFILDQDPTLSIDELKKEFISQDYWKKKSSDTIEMVKKSFNLQDIKLLNLNILSDTIVTKAKKIAESYRLYYQDKLGEKKEEIISELKTKSGKEDEQAWLLLQFLLEKNATKFNEELKNDFVQNWKQNHAQEICLAFSLDEISNFNQNMLQQSVIEKAQILVDKIIILYRQKISEKTIPLYLAQLVDEDYKDWENFIKQFDSKEWKENGKRQPTIKSLIGLLNCSIDDLNANKINGLGEKIVGEAKRLIEDLQNKNKQYKKDKNELISCYLVQLADKDHTNWDNFVKQFDDKTWKNNENNQPTLQNLVTLLNCSIDDLNADKINSLDKEIIDEAQQLIDKYLVPINDFQKKIKELQDKNKQYEKQLICCYLAQLTDEKYTDWDNFVKQFDNSTWKNKDKNKPTIENLIGLLNCTIEELNANKINDLDKEIIDESKTLLLQKKVTQDKLIKDITTKFKVQSEKENEQLWLLFQFLLEKNATKFNEELKNDFIQNWKQNHIKAMCSAFNLDEITNFNPSMLQQSVIEKAQEYVNTTLEFCHKEFATQYDKIREQIENIAKKAWLLFWFLLEKNATKFNEELKNDFFQNWKQDHVQEICSTFDLESIDSFQENMITQDILDETYNLIAIYSPFYENIVREKYKEFVANEMSSKNKYSNYEIETKIHALMSLLGAENLDDVIKKTDEIIKPEIDELMDELGVDYDELEKTIELIIGWINLIDALKIKETDDLSKTFTQVNDRHIVFTNLAKTLKIHDQSNIEELPKKFNDLEKITSIASSVNSLIKDFGFNNLIELNNKIFSFLPDDIKNANFLFNFINEYKIANIEQLKNKIFFLLQNEIPINKIFALISFYKKWSSLVFSDLQIVDDFGTTAQWNFSDLQIAWVNFLYAWKIKIQHAKEEIENLMLRQEFKDKDIKMLQASSNIDGKKNDQIQTLIDLMKIYKITKISELFKISDDVDSLPEIDKLQDLLYLMQTFEVKNFFELRKYLDDIGILNSFNNDNLKKIREIPISNLDEFKKHSIIITKNMDKQINNLLFLMSKNGVNSVKELKNKMNEFQSQLLIDKAQSIVTFLYHNTLNYFDDFKKMHDKINLVLQSEKYKNENINTLTQKIDNLHDELVINILTYFMFETNSTNYQDFAEFFDDNEWKNNQSEKLKNLIIVLGMKETDLNSDKIMSISDKIKNDVLTLNKTSQQNPEDWNNIEKLMNSFQQFTSLQKLMDVYQIKTVTKLNSYLDCELSAFEKQDDKNMLPYFVNILNDFKCGNFNELWQKLDNDEIKIKLWVELLKNLISPLPNNLSNIIPTIVTTIQGKISDLWFLAKATYESKSKNVESFIEKFNFFIFTYLMKSNKIKSFEDLNDFFEIKNTIPNFDFLLTALNNYNGDIYDLVDYLQKWNVEHRNYECFMSLFLNLMNASKITKIKDLIKEINSDDEFLKVFTQSYFDDLTDKVKAWVNFSYVWKIETFEDAKQKIEDLMKQQEFKDKNIKMLQEFSDISDEKNNQIQVLVDLMKVYEIDKISKFQTILPKISLENKEKNFLQKWLGLIHLMNLCKVKDFNDLKSKLTILNNWHEVFKSGHTFPKFINFMKKNDETRKFFDLIFELMNKLNFVKINDFESWLSDNRAIINSCHKVWKNFNEYKINIIDQNKLDNLFFEWLNFDQLMFLTKTKQFTEILGICEKNGSIFKKDSTKINAFISCMRVWNVKNSEKLIKKIDDKTLSVINLMNIFGDDVIIGIENFLKQRSKHDEKDDKDTLNAMSKLFEYKGISSWGLLLKISNYCGFFGLQNKNTILNEDLYNLHENLLFLLIKAKHLKKMMDTFGVNYDQLATTIQSFEKKEGDIIRYMLAEKIDTVEEIQQKFKNIIQIIYGPEHASEMINNPNSIDIDEIMHLKKAIVDLIKVQIADISYPELSSLSFDNKYTCDKIEQMIYENYLLMTAFGINNFNEISSKLESLWLLKNLIDKWKIKTTNILLDKLNDIAKKLENYNEYYKYSNGYLYEKPKEMPLDKFKKSFAKLSKNKQDQLFKLIHSLLDIFAASGKDYNKKNAEMYNDFNDKITTLINNFIKQTNINSAKGWTKKKDEDQEKIIKQYVQEE